MSLDVWFALAANLLLMLSAYGVGSMLLPLMPRSFLPTDRFWLSLAGGLGGLGVALFLLGQISYTRPVMAVPLGFGLALGVARAWRESCHVGFAAWRAQEIPAIPALLIVAVLLLTLLAGSVEVIDGPGHDGIAYHFMGPKVWLRDGIIRPVLPNTHTAFPATIEVLFGALMAFGGPLAPTVFAVPSMAIVFGVLLTLGERTLAGDRAHAWWAVALFAAMPAVHTGGHSGFVDVLFAGFVLAAARVVTDAERQSEYALAGLFCGLAIATKYTGLLATGAIIGAALVARPWRATASGPSPRRGLLIAVVCAVMLAAPFYLRNWILLGCPIYPPPLALAQWCTARYLTSDWIQGFHDYIYHARGSGFGRGIADFLWLPVRLTYFTERFHGAGGIGIAVLALAPFGFPTALRSSAGRLLIVLCSLLVILWFVTQQESRFLIHGYAISAILAVAGWREVGLDRSSCARTLGRLVIAVSLLYGLATIAHQRVDALRAALSDSARRALRRERIPWLESIEYINREPAVRSVAVLLGHFPVYYLDKQFVIVFNGKLGAPIGESRTSDAQLARLRSRGVSHILDVQDSSFAFMLSSTSPFRRLVFERSGQRLYELR